MLAQTSVDFSRQAKWEREVRPCALVAPTAEPNLQELYARYRTSLIAHCARFLRDKALAEDATHEVFLRVQRHAGKLPEASEIRPWLFRVATNYCLNELRRRDVRARSLLSITHTEPARLDESLWVQTDARRFLERLRPRARAVAWLTYVDGMLQKEVAETLGVSRRTVVNHLAEARARMRETQKTSAPAT